MYREQQFKLSFLRISETQEIDLIVEKPRGKVFLCEIKASNYVDERHARSLNNLLSDFKNAKAFIISNDEQKKQIGNVIALHWKEALEIVCE